MNSIHKRLLLILLLLALAIVIDLPAEIKVDQTWFGRPIKFNLTRPEINWQLGPWLIKRDLKIKQGLDLQGGVQLTLAADMAGVEPADRDQALESARAIVSRRIDLYGVTEPIIQTLKTDNNYRLTVELPGADSYDQALGLIGQTAQLDFRSPPPDFDLNQSPEATPTTTIFDFISTDLTGKDLARASVQFSQAAENAGQPIIALEFTPNGKDKFSQITTNNVGQPLAIFLDEMPITAPIVNEPITDGQAIISGGFTVDQAKTLAIQLNAGALPVPLTIIEQKNIEATLGKSAVEQSLRAGLIGLGLVMLFMLALYGGLGLVADLGLVIYGLLTLAIYKLIPVTLSLPGLAGFILSVGMAVDANILIFERFKEEVRSGKPKLVALELAFGQAWDSIKDANVCTLIICFILFNPFNWGWLNSSGMIRGFSLTLFLGVVISLFTGVVVTRTLLRLLIKDRVGGEGQRR